MLHFRGTGESRKDIAYTEGTRGKVLCDQGVLISIHYLVCTVVWGLEDKESGFDAKEKNTVVFQELI